MFLCFFNAACAVGNSKLPKEMPNGVEIRFNANYGGSPAYKTIVVKTGGLTFETKDYVPEKRTFEETKWSAKISGEDLVKLYQVFVANKFDAIKNDEREEITYDAPGEGIVISSNERDSFQKGYGKNELLSGGNLRRYETVKQAIFDLAAKYAETK